MTGRATDHADDIRNASGGEGEDARASGPSMTFPRSLRAETLRLRRSSLVPLHLICALAAGAACGAYFATAPWDASMGADAFVQLLGAMMPLMAGIVCGLDVDAEWEATCFSGMLAVPSRRKAIAARLCTLWLMGAFALMLAAAAFAAPLILVGRQALGPAAWAGAVVGLAFGSIPLYLVLYVAALRWGRNAAIVAGAAGLMLSFFSIGGLAHGLMTGALTAADANALSYLPTSWPALLGSLPIELSIAGGSAGSLDAAAHVAGAIWSLAGLCAVATVLLAGGLAAWISRFEPVRHGE